MYLSNIKLWNFRKYGGNEFDLASPHLDLNFNPGLNVLIGENDSGKTAIIDAIKLVLKTHSYEPLGIREDDFFNESTRLRIELRIDGFGSDGEEAKYFLECLNWEGEGDGCESFLRLQLDATRNPERVLPYDIRAGKTDIGNLLSAEAREILKATYLKPLRDASNELVSRRGSRLSRILYGHAAFKNREEDHHLIEALEEFSASVEKYFEGKKLTRDGLGNVEESDLDNDQLGKELKATIDEYVKAFCDDTKESEFQAFAGDLKSILERLELSIKDERNLGLGSLNRLFMASELLHLAKSAGDGLRLGLVEELEAHLHPQAQMQVVEFLQSHAGIQLILTTHSPNLASKVKLGNLIICHENSTFPLGAGMTKLEEPNYVFLEKFLDVTKSNLFFAKGLILVEGWAEEIFLPSLARNLGYDLTKHGVSIVNVGSLAFSNYSKIFLRKGGPDFPMPVAIISDSDIQAFEKDENAILTKVDEATIAAETIAKIDDLKTKYDDQNVKAFIAPTWTFEFAVFKSSALGELFRASAKAVHSQTNWDDGFELALANKLLNKGLNKTEIAYRLANTVDLLTAPMNIADDDSASYLRDALKYVCRK